MYVATPQKDKETRRLKLNQQDGDHHKNNFGYTNPINPTQTL